MNKAETQAKAGLFVLLLIAAILLVGAGLYGMEAWWAGGLAAVAMAFPAGLTVWGLILARQQTVLADDEAISAGATVSNKQGMTGFRMSYGDDSAIAPTTSAREAKVLETGFQRVIVSLAAVVFLIVTGVIAYLLTVRLGAVGPGKPMQVSPVALDNLGLLIGISAPLIFLILYSMTRVTRATQGYGEAINGIFSMGLPGMVMVAVATVCGYFKVTYISEIAAAVVGLLLLLQAMELLVNALKSYNGVAEFDQDPVDLGALPLVPMVTSNWIVGVRMLLAQSVGLGTASSRVSQEGAGVIARMMPRVLVAAVILFIGVNCLAIVHPGEVAIRERLGLATEDDIDHPLQPGLHARMPWPIDELVRIPVERVTYAPVGAEETTVTKSGKQLGFRVWTIAHSGTDHEPDFVTGDSPPKLLGGYVGVWWKVKDPEAFYRNLSHSTFLDTARTGGETEDTERPIYEIIVRGLASKGVNQTFAVHTAEEILSTQCEQVGIEARERIQADLDRLQSGIEIVNLTIKDVHPPIGIGRRRGAVMAYGPADAYELFMENRELKASQVAQADAMSHRVVAMAEAEAASIYADAQIQAERRRAAADVSATRLKAIAPEFTGDQRGITKQYYLYRMLVDPSNQQGGFGQTTKIILGKDVTPPDIWERGNDGTLMPAGGPGMPQ